jgi:hypothetical protein
LEPMRLAKPESPSPTPMVNSSLGRAEQRIQSSNKPQELCMSEHETLLTVQGNNKSILRDVCTIQPVDRKLSFY